MSEFRNDHPLSIRDVESLHRLIDACGRTAKVARLRPDDSIVYGHARYICNDSGYFLTKDQDVRNAYMRVTTRSGFEEFWPIAELMGEVHAGTFGVDVDPPS